MQKTLLAAFAAAAVLAGATPGTRAVAMMVAPPPLPALASAPAASLERVTNVCGINGCAPVQIKRMHKPPPNFTKMAVPLMINVNQHQNAAPPK